MSLAITSYDLPDAHRRLALSGEIDLSSVKAMREAIALAVKDRATGTVTVDLGEVTFIDSTGIAALIGGRKLADVCATTLRVVNPRDLVRRVLEITGVLAYLDNGAATVS